MKRSKIVAGALALVPAAGLLALTQLADAHHPDIEAEVVCLDERAQVTITASSWITEEVPRRYNDNIAIQWDGATVGNGKFTPSNGYEFQVTFLRPADGTTHTATAVAIAPFGANGEFGFEGTFAEISVELPEDCVPASTTTPPDTVVVDDQVLGTSITRPAEPDVAPAVEVLPRFAG